MSRLTRGLCELTLQTSDPAALADFYRRVLGFEELSRDDDRIWLACGPTTRLGLWSPGEKEFGDEGGHHVHHAYSTTRGALAEIGRRLDALGVAFKGPVEHDGGDRSLYFEDPEGNLVEAWDFFESGDGARDGVAALAES
ncbi:MAG TPA: VOC family protein [Baekduia sp.]|uniref:VOC family protein n=1 Tax=Baekduia sp. TaxID=2600305 RepID=UPI002D780AF3|nr:VOC family protein [Baekduia sp.]HET6506060.1 VOC family protein [Baekduia sp.]